MKTISTPVKMFFSEKEAAIYLGVSYAELRDWRNKSNVSFLAKKEGKKILYKKDDLDAVIEELFNYYPSDRIRTKKK